MAEIIPIFLLLIFLIILIGFPKLLPISRALKSDLENFKNSNPPKIITGYSLRKEDVYLEISIENVISQCIDYNIKPKAAQIWKHYSDWSAELITNLDEYTYIREPNPVELREIYEELDKYEESLKDKKKKQVNLATSSLNFSGMMISTTGDYWGGNSIENKLQQLKRDKCLEWKEEYTKIRISQPVPTQNDKIAGLCKNY
jgi:hypothetical protein